MVRQNGAAIRAIRTAQKIQLRELARRIDRDPGFLCHVEANRCYASQQTIDRLAAALNVAPEALSRDPA